MQEEANDGIGKLFAEHAGEKHQVVVIDPD